MDEIAERLQRVIDEHGPEAFAVATSTWNTSIDNGMGRRVMNLLGSPNRISGVEFCMGNTSAVNKLTLGWFPWPDLINTDLIVLNGHNPRKNSWTPIYNFIRKAQARGAKLIVLDPRVSGQAERADIHLQLRAGTDAAMYLGWLNVIIKEEPARGVNTRRSELMAGIMVAELGERTPLWFQRGRCRSASHQLRQRWRVAPRYSESTMRRDNLTNSRKSCGTRVADIQAGETFRGSSWRHCQAPAGKGPVSR